MLITPSHPHLWQDREHLIRWLLACQQTCCTTDGERIVSLSVEIAPIDPLLALHAIARSDELQFYFKQGRDGDAIAAIGSVMQLQADGRDRFEQSRQFVQSGLNRVTSFGDLDLPFSGPHFACSFTFFNDPHHPDSPFPAATVFLPQWQIARTRQGCVLVANLAMTPQTPVEPLADRLWQTVRHLQLAKYYPIDRLLRSARHFLQEANSSEAHFKQSVRSALDAIARSDYRKIVLAHTIDVNLDRRFHIVNSLNNLHELHPDCYIFAIGNGRGQYFLGASPERLISMRDRHLFTDAIAGSAPRGNSDEADTEFGDRLLSSQKERHEHRYVTEFITQSLTNLGLHPQRSPLRLLKLSNIQHLWTPIQAKVPNDLHLLQILSQLHPTPAVAGTPRDMACREIRRYELFDRSLYAAPLGWIDGRGNGEFIVGIRSAIVNDCHARLFAGAGIVAGSDPDKELAEVQLKLQALLEALV